MKTRIRSFRFLTASIPLLAALLSSGLFPSRVPAIPGFPGGLPLFFLSSDPVDNATGVPTSKVVKFTFTAPVAANSKVVWSANVNPSDVNYALGTDPLTQMNTLLCTPKTAWPAGVITWDVAAIKGTDGGDVTAISATSGRFTTSAGATGPCDPVQTGAKAGATVMKSESYSQSGPGAPIPAASGAAFFGASASSTATDPIKSASVDTPKGTTEPLTGLFGNFFAGVPLSSVSALEAAYPDGADVVKAQRQSGLVQLTLNLSKGNIPVPQINNYPALQSVDAGADMPVQFNGIPGATGNDLISFSVSTGSGSVFFLPNPCLNLPLPNTATSLTIPKGTLQAGQTYEATLSYNHTSDQNSSVADFPGAAVFTRTTSFRIITSGGGGQAAPPRFVAYTRLPDGSFQMKVTGSPSSTYTILSSTDLTTWAAISTQQTSAAGEINFTDVQAKSATRMYYRARSGQ
jgi:hypothetical protein